ncbi:MAG TPA: serine/threonine-protein kinase [Planctomycetota bacterium]|nr:serine/threonine-protein kinase [Planctomycetota bacterium]
MAQLGDYELLEEVGRGGAGTVHRGRAPDGSVVALKILPLARDIERTRREVRLLSELGAGKGFVPVLDAFGSPQGCVIVMPFIAGGTLREKLRRGPLEIAETVALGKELGRALGEAHARGIVHRDLKPENVLFTGDGRPLIADLGLAKHFMKDAPGAALSLSLTLGGELKGTIGYAAPEQLSDAKEARPPADVFGLGAILHECLTGTPVFQSETLLGVLHLTQKGARGSLDRARKGLPRPLVAAIERALEPDPGARQADGAAFVAALETAGPRSRTPIALGVAIAAVVTAVVALATIHTRTENVGTRALVSLQGLERKGAEAFDAGRYAEAERAFTEALAIEPRREGLLLARGRAAARAGDDGRALADFAELWGRARGRDPKSFVDFAPALYRLATRSDVAGIGTALTTAAEIGPPPPGLAAAVADRWWEAARAELERWDPLDIAGNTPANRELARKSVSFSKRAYEADPSRLPDAICEYIATIRALVETANLDGAQAAALWGGWPDGPLARFAAARERYGVATSLKNDAERRASTLDLVDAVEKALRALPPRRTDEHREIGTIAEHLASFAAEADRVLGGREAAIEDLVGRCAARSGYALSLVSVAKTQLARRRFESAGVLLDMALLAPATVGWRELRSSVAEERLELLREWGHDQEVLADTEDLDAVAENQRQSFVVMALLSLGRYEDVVAAVPFAVCDMDDEHALITQKGRMRALVKLGRADEARRLLAGPGVPARFAEYVGRGLDR